MKYEVLISDGNQRCDICRATVDSDEVKLGSTSTCMGVTGATLWRHLKCLTPADARKLVSEAQDETFPTIKGFADLNDGVKTDFAQQITDISEKKATTPAKKAGGTKRKSAKEPKEKKEKKEKKPRKAKEPKEKKEKKEKDPDMPKRPKTSYMLYSEDNRARIKEENPDIKPKEVMQKLGAEWKAADQATKEEYGEKAKEAKAEYEKAMKKYNAKQNGEEAEEEEAEEEAEVEAEEEEAEGEAEEQAEEENNEDEEGAPVAAEEEDDE